MYTGIWFVLVAFGFASLYFLAYIILTPFVGSWRRKHRARFVESIAAKLVGSDVRFVTKTKNGLTAVTTNAAWVVANDERFSSPLEAWPTFTFGVPNYPARKGQIGTLDDLEDLYADVISSVTGHSREEFTREEFDYLVSWFVLTTEHLFVPGAELPDENAQYWRLMQPTTIEHAREVIRA